MNETTFSASRLETTVAGGQSRAATRGALVSAVMVLLLVGTVLVVYWPIVRAPFVMDDLASVELSRSITRLWPLWGEVGKSPLRGATTSPTASRPLVNYSFALNYAWDRLDPSGYHFVNMALHALSVLTLWGLVRRVLLLDYFQGRFALTARPLAFAAALVFAVHPLCSETVVYVTQRTEGMMALFYLATLYAALRYWTAASRGGRRAWLALSILACLAGMLCKEIMVSAPVIVLLFERTFLTGTARRALRESWPLYLGLCLTWLPLAALNLLGPRTPLAGFDMEVPAVTYWMTQTKVVWIYLKLAVWPWPLKVQYQVPWLETFAAAWPWLLATGSLFVLTLVLLWRRWAAGFVGILFFASLSPTLVVPMPYEVAAERRMYLPLAALVALAVVAIYELLAFLAARFAARERRAGTSRAPIALTTVGCLALSLLFALLTSHRVVTYASQVTFWEEFAALEPDNYGAHVNLGIALQNAGRLDAAIDEFNRSVELEPDTFETHHNLARALEEKDRKAEAIDHYRLALAASPDHPAAHINLAILLADAGRYEQAIEHYQQALRINPNIPPAHINLGILLSGMGQYERAMTHFEEAVRLDPSVAACSNLAVAYAQLGRDADAIAMAEQAIALARADGQIEHAERLEAALAQMRNRAAADAAAKGNANSEPDARVP